MLMIYKSVITVITISCSSNNYVTIMAITRDSVSIDISTILTILTGTTSTRGGIYIHRTPPSRYCLCKRITKCTIITVSNSTSPHNIASSTRSPSCRDIRGRIFTYARCTLCLKYLARASRARDRFQN